MRNGIDVLEKRTRQFAIAAVRLTASMRTQPHLMDIARQLARSSTSVAANQRAMRRARSMNEFAAKLQIVNEEIDEAASWLEMLEELTSPATDQLRDLRREALELRAIYAKARRTTREKLLKRQSGKGAKSQ